MQLFLIINLFILFDIFVMHLNGEPSIFNLKIYYSVKMSPNYTMFILNAWNHHGPLLKAHIVWPIRYGPYQWSYCTKTKQDCTTSKVHGGMILVQKGGCHVTAHACRHNFGPLNFSPKFMIMCTLTLRMCTFGPVQTV